MARKKALIAGVLGLVGRNMAAHLAELGDWDVVGISRRFPDFESRFHHLSVDLADASDCATKLGSLRDVTHVFYAARAPHSDPAEEAVLNRQMLGNLVETMEANNGALRHINLVHGSKW